MGRKRTKTLNNKKASKKRVLRKKKEPLSNANKSYLDVQQHHHQFFVNDGQILKNVSELPDALQNMDAQTFAHHVNSEKHDFANWVHDVMGAESLAREMRSAKTKRGLLRTMRTKL